MRGGQLRQSAEALLCGSVIRQVGKEVERLARIFVGDHGVRKIRLTGGEPLVRRELTLAFGLRSLLQLRRTGSTGFRGLTSAC
jgi:hypothetical protein